jgi:superfamily II DNA or RNA helicase
MAKLSDLTVNSVVRGIIPNEPVTIRHIERHGEQAATVTYVDNQGRVADRVLFKDDEPNLELVQQSRPLSFDGDGYLFRLASEAQRLRLAFLFDPLIAVNTSSVEPLPHQITAVYERMLQQQPLRFLLADDPGAGKTIMAGLLIKELIIRGDISKCLIVAPGNLVEQWQDELDEKFNLQFEIMTNEALESARTGNWFQEHSLCLCRLDKLSRNDEIQAKLKVVDWDLVVVDEAHKMSATYFGNEVKYTKRFRLGQMLSEHTRQFLLMTATPHNGKEQDFQLFLSLLDGDRFEGRLRDGIHLSDISDVMRRMVKEKLLKMDGKRLFQERFAYTLPYPLSPDEAALYKEVTDYVRNEFDRAEKLESEGRKGTVGFALTILQRRLASSPEAIYQSLRRRRERLEARLREERLLRRGALAQEAISQPADGLSPEELDDIEETPADETESVQEEIADQATAARTIAELETEIQTLRGLEANALRLRRSGKDTKWQNLSETLMDNPKMFDAQGNRRKLVIFTEQRDTLNYLQERLSTLLGQPDAVVCISGLTPREKRRQIQESFRNESNVLILIATDAAGEGINLQRAHLMVNYDLPWNPNRLEQRFGRIHRIGQREVCHLWNLVAKETREGEIYYRLLEKIAEQSRALNGAVFDVLGKVFEGRPLRELLIEAVRYGETPAVRAKLDEVIGQLDRDHLEQLLHDKLLAEDHLDSRRVREIREAMERAQARRLQPHYIGSFFSEAFAHFGGQIQKREPMRMEIRHVPGDIRNRDRITGLKAPVLRSYERITFIKEAILVDGKPPAALVAPGHPLLDATVDLVLEKYRSLLRQGAILVDPNDAGREPRVLLYLEQSIVDGRNVSGRNERVISRQLHFVEHRRDGAAIIAGYAPYLDYTAATPEQKAQVQPLLEESWLRENLESKTLGFAIQKIVPEHLQEVKKRREAIVRKTITQVKDRLTREINYWDHRAEELKAMEDAGKSRSNLNSSNARQRADGLAERLKKRLQDLELELKIAARPPHIIGGALVIPAGYFAAIGEDGTLRETPPPYGMSNKEIERLAMEKVLAFEREQGFEPRDVSTENRGYDIESRDAKTGSLRFIEVKGRAKGAEMVTVTKNEILTGLNRPDAYFLAVVFVAGGAAETPRYVPRPFAQEPEFAAASVNLKLADIFTRAIS